MEGLGLGEILLYKINRDVPANTAIASPDWQKLQVCKGTIKEWIVYGPKQAADITKFRVEYKGTQIFPFTRGEWMDVFPNAVKFAENLKLDASPYVLDVFAYNLGDRLTHEYNLYVNVLRDEPFIPPTSGFNIKEAWSNLFGGG